MSNRLPAVDARPLLAAAALVVAGFIFTAGPPSAPGFLVRRQVASTGVPTVNALAAVWPAGSAAYASYTALPLTDGATAMTFAARIRVPTSWPVSEQTIFHRDSSSSIQRHIMVNLGPSRNVVIYIASTLTGAWTTCTTQTNGFSVDTTTMLTVVFNGGLTGDANRLRVYASTGVDGAATTVQQTCTFSGTVPAAMTIPTTAAWTIGATFAGLTSLRSATIDDLAYWSGIPAALSQVNETYNAGRPYDPRLASSMGPPIAYWNFEGGNLNEAGPLGAPGLTTGTGAITYSAAIAFISYAPTAPVTPGCGQALTANTQRQLTWSVNEGGTVRIRGAYLSIPQDYDPARLYPIEEMYHGCSFTGAGLRADVNGPDIEAQSYRGVVALYPDGLAEVTCIPTNATGWDLTSASHDLYFFDSIQRAMRAQVCFDETQLLVGGRSMGGGFAQVLAGSRPSVIAKIATVSTAIAPLATPSAKWMYIGHNTNDPTVNVSVARAARDAWIGANGCSAPVTSPWNTNCTSYTCTGAPLLYCEWAGGGHTPDAANAGLIWQHWAWPGPLDAPQRLGPLANTAGNYVSLTGDSTMYGASSVAVTTSPPWGSVYRSGPSYPFTAIREGTAAGGSGFNVESPATALGAQMRALRPASQAARSHVIGNHSVSGATYDYLRKGSGISNAYLDAFGSPSGDLYTARSAAAGGGLTMRVSGVGIRSGHNDDNAFMCATFAANYAQLQADIDADVRAMTSQSNRVPLYWLQFSSWQVAGVFETTGLCATEMERLVSTNPRTQVLCAPSYHMGSGASTIYAADGIHFTAAGYDLSGEMLGMCMHSVEAAGQPWSPLIPRSVTISTANSIDIDYTGRIPCQRLNSTNTGTTACDATDCCTGGGTYLAFDTTNVVTPFTGDQASTPQYGYELSCPGPRPPWVTSVAISGTHVTITTDKPIPVGCTVAYARTAIGGAYAGNGTAATGYGGPRGQLRDTMAVVGRVTGQTLYTWGATWLRTLSGGASPPATVSAAFQDREWDYLFVASSTAPAAASAWPDGRSGFSIPYAAGTWSIGARAASIPADGVGAYTIVPSGTPGYWHQTGGANHQFDAVTNQNMWIRWAGVCNRPGSNYYLYHYYGAANNEYYLQIGSTGNVVAYLDGTSGGGAALSYNRVGLWPTDDRQCLLDVYYDARAGTAGTPRVTVCLNGDCAATNAGSTTGDVVGGDLTLGAFRTGSGPYGRPSYGWGFAFGQKAHQQWGPDASVTTRHTADYARFCPSGPCY